MTSKHVRRKEHRIAAYTTSLQGGVETVQCVCGAHNCRWAAYPTPFTWRGVGDREWRRQSWGRRARRQGASGASRA